MWSDGNRIFDRQAYVGLITPFGAMLAGRQYTPAYETFATFDTMATESALSAGQVAQFPAVFEIRNSNALAYRIVKDGFSGALMYAPGEVPADSSAGSSLLAPTSVTKTMLSRWALATTARTTNSVTSP